MITIDELNAIAPTWQEDKVLFNAENTKVFTNQKGLVVGYMKDDEKESYYLIVPYAISGTKANSYPYKSKGSLIAKIKKFI